MIIIPTLEILKAVTDNNIDSAASKPRRDAFTAILNLKSLTCTEIVLEGLSFERISARLNSDHIKAFGDTCRIDETAKGLHQGTIQAAQYIAIRDSRTDKVLIITENKSSYNQKENLKVITPTDFLEKYNSKIVPIILGSQPLNKEFREAVITEQLERVFFP